MSLIEKTPMRKFGVSTHVLVRRPVEGAGRWGRMAESWQQEELHKVDGFKCCCYRSLLAQ
jgi:hypothetical protein